jgi:hypothetical protein
MHLIDGKIKRRPRPAPADGEQIPDPASRAVPRSWTLQRGTQVTDEGHKSQTRDTSHRRGTQVTDEGPEVCADPDSTRNGR